MLARTAGLMTKGIVMTSSRVSILVGAAIGFVALLGSAAPSVAADLGLKDSYAPPPPQRTWYLKGTIGMHSHDVGGMDNEDYTDLYTIGHTDMKSAPFFGLGIGVDHGRWLRFDVTGEYRGKWLFIGQDSYTNVGCVGGPGAGCGTNEFTADIEGWVGLLNAYVDLGAWCGITPFVGGGVGFAQMSVLGLKDVNVPAQSVWYGADNSQTNFAWALYAGMSYDVTERVTLDFGYRYLDIGDISSGRVTAYDGSDSYSKHIIQDVTSHDLMFSARFALDRRAPVPVEIK
jgi:opacity protein-like surface antigen